MLTISLFLSFTYEVLLPEKRSLQKYREGTDEQVKWHQANPEHGTFNKTHGLASLKSSSWGEKKKREG